jgi:hypothetical protein
MRIGAPGSNAVPSGVTIQTYGPNGRATFGPPAD